MMSRSDLAPDPWGDRVQPDHHAIGQMAADYLLERGHRRLAYLNPDTTLPIYRHRLTAFRSAAEAAGVSTHVYASKGIEDLNLEAQHLVAQWMASSDRPTALFVPVDRVTLFIYRHLERRGVTPGKDVDIISCDNEKQLLSLMNPPPASIDLNREMIARLAVERLLWRMRNGVSSPSVVTAVSPTLMARETLEGKELEVAPA